MKLYLQILILTSLNIFGGMTDWNEDNLKVFYERHYSDVYTAKMTTYKFVSQSGHEFSYDEYNKYETMRKFLEHKIEEFSDTFYEFMEGSYKPEPFLLAKKEVLKFEKKSTESREKIVELYEQELKKYPLLKGKFHAELKINTVFKGKLKKDQIIKRIFAHNPHSMCPHSTVLLLDMEEKIILDKEMKIGEVLQMKKLKLIQKLDQQFRNTKNRTNGSN